jgi:hypothetical protein
LRSFSFWSGHLILIVFQICIWQVLEKSDDFAENPFSKYRIGQVLHARIIAKADHTGKGGKVNLLELSVRPSLLEGTLLRYCLMGLLLKCFYYFFLLI